MCMNNHLNNIFIKGAAQCKGKTNCRGMFYNPFPDTLLVPLKPIRGSTGPYDFHIVNLVTFI